MLVVGKRIVNEKELKCVVDCTACFIEERSDGYCVRLNTAHPSIFYSIIGAKKRSNGVYYLLSLSEAERIVDGVVKGTVFLDDYGNYKICDEKIMQTVYVRNDICDYDGEDIPIYTKNIDD